MTTALIVALVGVLLGPAVSVALFRGMGKREASTAEQTQNIALARLEEKVDGIPDKMNGKILRALDKHAERCAYRANTNPAIPRYDSEILP